MVDRTNFDPYSALLPSDIKNQRHLMFVYGTLKREHGNDAHGLYLKDATFIGKCSVQGVLLHLGKYPGMVITPDEICRVTGEVYEVNIEHIKVLDRYEGVPHNYIRRLTITPFGQAWVYYKVFSGQLADPVVCVDRGLWMGGLDDRAPYRSVREYFKNRRWLEPSERARKDQPITYDVIPESSPARGPVVVSPPTEKPKPKVVIKPFDRNASMTGTM